MKDWLSNQIGEGAANIVISLVVLIIVIAAIMITITLLRRINGNHGTFVAGGKGRTPRLSVTDATAVDSARRLVLVKRDDVEHLILIGGPTDIVVESNIKIQESQKQYPVHAQTSQRQNIVQERQPAVTASNATMQQYEPIVKTTTQAHSSQIHAPSISAERKPQNNSSYLPTSDLGDLSKVHAPIKDETITAEIEGRREPSLSMPSSKPMREPAMEDEFDRMFEDELRQAVEKDR